MVTAETLGYAEKKDAIQGGATMTVLLIAAGSIAAIWVIVLLGSPMFGSDH